VEAIAEVAAIVTIEEEGPAPGSRTDFRHIERGSVHWMFPAIINSMSADCDAAPESQFSSYSVNPGRVLAALPGVSTAVSGEFAFAVASFSLR
jgi:hypothetical protein